MDAEIFKEYLVALGWKIDHPGLRKFEDTLKQAGQAAERITGGMAKTAIYAGTAVTSALTGIAASALGLMSNVATADLSFQMFARRMYLGTDQARHMKIALDALGVSAEDVIFGPPELAERYKALTQLQSKFEQEFGGTAEMEKRLKQFRDLQFRLTEFKVAFGQIARAFTSSLFSKIFGDGKAQEKLDQLLDKLVRSAPRIVDELSTGLVPILKNVKDIWVDLVEIGKDGASMFLRFVGMIYGDQTLQAGEVNIKNIAKAIEDVSGSIKTLFDWLTKIADFISKHSWLSNILLSTAGGAKIGSYFGPEGTAIGALGGFASGTILDEMGRENKKYIDRVQRKGLNPKETEWYKRFIAMRAAKMGIPPAIAEALVSVESGFDPRALSNKGAIGLMQLMPGTAQGLGVNPNDPIENISGGLTYLNQLYHKYGNWTQALEAYNAGPGNIDKGIIPSETSKYANDVLGRANQFGLGAPTINVGGVTINVMQPNASPEQIKQATIEAIQEASKKQVQRNMLQLSGVYP